MREINVNRVTESLCEACGFIACNCSPDIYEALKHGAEQETSEQSRMAMDMLLKNAEIAHEERIPICQDTGLAIIWLTVGQDVHFINGDINEAIQLGIRKGYTGHFLRASAVDDPLFNRINTKDNTPAVIYTSIVPGDQVKIELMAKGFGSENMSRVKMLKPAEGMDGVKQFVLETIKMAGPNACPPMIVGVGIGGTFDSCAVMSKHSLLRPLSQNNENSEYASMERELCEQANLLKIGPMGLHGKTTVLKIQIEQSPTHIAGLPCAVNICCHACRHAEVIL
ncbi:MAG: fumarate hydratase [Erysipelotrichia bacterium]|nr:fumarate hydratase [Erysipelotrichia bacterium]